MERIELTHVRGSVHGQFSNLKKKGTPKISAEVTRDYPSFCAQRARRLFRLMQNRPYLLLVSTHYIESHSAGRIRAQSPRRRCCHSSTLGEPRRVQRKTD